MPHHCTREMDNFEFDIYTEFFINVGHIWQERMESVILGLCDSSMMAVNKLEQSLEYHQVIDEKQSQTLKIQEEILDHDRKITNSLYKTSVCMTLSFTHMEKMAKDLRNYNGYFD